MLNARYKARRSGFYTILYHLISTFLCRFEVMDDNAYAGRLNLPCNGLCCYSMSCVRDVDKGTVVQGHNKSSEDIELRFSGFLELLFETRRGSSRSSLHLKTTTSSTRNCWVWSFDRSQVSSDEGRLTTPAGFFDYCTSFCDLLSHELVEIYHPRG